MQLLRFEEVEPFHARVLPFLTQREAHNNLLLGLLSTLRVDPLYYGDPPYMSLVQAGADVVAVALRTPPHKLCLSYMGSLDALPLIMDDVALCFPLLPGALGPSEPARAFVTQWTTRTGQSARLEIAERIYQLTKVNPVPGVPGHLRPLSLTERDTAVEWMMAFNAEALEPVERGQVEAMIDRELAGQAGRRYYMWDVDGQPVSLVGCGGYTPNGIRIGPVYTPPPQRRHGYASACVAALSQRLLDEGRRYVFLFTDLSNPTSNHIYQQIGYEPVCDVDLYRFD